jgi:hypothetical protein
MRLLRSIVPALFPAVLLAACQRHQNTTPTTDASQFVPSDTRNGTAHLVVVSPTTGKVTVDKEVSLDGMEDQVRAAFGGPSVAEEKETKQYMTRADVMKFKGKVKCWYLVTFNTGARLDPDGKMWDGVSYDAFVAPVLEELPNGFFKTVKPANEYDSKERAAAKDYVVIYFKSDRFNTNWRHTDWVTSDVTDQRYGDSDVPELCPTPKAGRQQGRSKK